MSGEGSAARMAHSTPKHPKSGAHGTPLRGLDFTPSSSLKEGRFGRLFRTLPPADYGTTDDHSIENLKDLGDKMTAGPHNAIDGPQEKESGIPALYTYFGQFIDHDLTFDPASSLQKQNDPDALFDYRTPAFDLDSVYGCGPDDQPYMFDDLSEHRDGSAQLFLLGGPLHAPESKNEPEKPPTGWDLPRNTRVVNRLDPPQPSRALIADPRNDENAIISQLHGLFLRFHNRMAQEKQSFGEVQQQLRFHYEYLVLNDFLPRIVHSRVLADLKTGGHYDRRNLKFYDYQNYLYPFMPVEFSVAAYRLGHSMVRPGYRLNGVIHRPIFTPLKPIATKMPNPDLRGFQPLPTDWAIDWGRFIDIEKRPYDGSKEANRRRLQFAFKIDTALVEPLSRVPDLSSSRRITSLAQRTLVRGYRLQLPSGQSVAHAMGIDDKDVLIDDEIVVGKSSITRVSPMFQKNCPLWTYILAEAMNRPEEVEIPVLETKPIRISTPKLGQVGGRIVAEVFLGLMFGDRNSLLNVYPTWKPELNSRKSYTLKDFVQYALGYTPTSEVTAMKL